MSTPSSSQLQGDREVGVSITDSPLYVPWQTISTLASETGQAVRQTFSDSGIGTSGHVQQGIQYHVSPSEHSDHSPQSQESLLDSGQANWKGETASADDDMGEAVQAEVQRVQTKMMSSNAATEVILRFNFMGGRESRVGQRCRGSNLQQGPTLLGHRWFCAGCIAVPGDINHCGSCCVDNRICEQDAGGRLMISCSTQAPVSASTLVSLTMLTQPTHSPFLLDCSEKPAISVPTKDRVCVEHCCWQCVLADSNSQPCFLHVACI